MVNKDNISDELLAAFLEGNVNEKEMKQVLEAVGTNAEYVLRQRGIQVDEEDLLEIAKDNHWIKRAGTPLQFMGNLMEHMGLIVSRRYEAGIEDIKDALEKGNSVIVAVDSDKLYPERPDEEDATNHAIVITAINTEDNMATIFDPANVSEIELSLELLESAWYESQHYLVCAK